MTFFLAGKVCGVELADHQNPLLCTTAGHIKYGPGIEGRCAGPALNLSLPVDLAGPN